MPIGEHPLNEARSRDVLSEMLRDLRLDGVRYGRYDLHDGGSLNFAADAQQGLARFHHVAQGRVWLQVGGGEWQLLQSGDAVLLPQGSVHVLASEPSATAVCEGGLPRQALTEQLFVVQCGAPRVGAPGPMPETVVFSGQMRFNLDAMHPLRAMLPAIMHAGELAQRDPAVPALLDAMEREVHMERVGSCGILSRLADVLAASIIRGWVERVPEQPEGWMAALRCPRLGAVIAALHRHPERDWTVASMAALCGASRSSFAAAFVKFMGEPPAKYLTRLRMAEARRWMSDEGLRVSSAAQRLGYESEAAFSRAFKRVMGVAPSAARAKTPGRAAQA